MSIKKLCFCLLIILFSISFYFLELYSIDYHDEYKLCVTNKYEYPVKCDENTTFEEYQYYYNYAKFLNNNLFNIDNITHSIALNSGIIALAILIVFYQDKRNLVLKKEISVIIWSIIDMVIGFIGLIYFILSFILANMSFKELIDILINDDIYIISLSILSLGFILNGIIKIRYIKYVKNEI